MSFVPSMNLYFRHRPISFRISNTYKETIDFLKKAYIGDPNSRVNLKVKDNHGVELKMNETNYKEIINAVLDSGKQLEGKLDYKYSDEKQIIVDIIDKKMDAVFEEIEQEANKKIAEKMEEINNKFLELKNLIKEKQN